MFFSNSVSITIDLTIKEDSNKTLYHLFILKLTQNLRRAAELTFLG